MKILKGGQSVEVMYEDDSSSEVFVRQLPLRDYESAFLKIDDEMEITALICGKDKAWVMTIQPESYEQLRKVALEVNEKGFFVYADRRKEELTRRVSSLSPDMLKAAMSHLNPSPSVSRLKPV